MKRERLAALIGLSLASGVLDACATVEYTESTVSPMAPAVTEAPVDSPIPYKASAHVDGPNLSIDLDHAACATTSQERTQVTDVTYEKPSTAGALATIGLGIGLGALGAVSWSRAGRDPTTCAMDDSSCTTQGQARGGGIVLLGTGVIAAGVGIYRLFLPARRIGERQYVQNGRAMQSSPYACQAPVENVAMTITHGNCWARTENTVPSGAGARAVFRFSDDMLLKLFPLDRLRVSMPGYNLGDVAVDRLVLPAWGRRLGLVLPDAIRPADRRVWASLTCLGTDHLAEICARKTGDNILTRLTCSGVLEQARTCDFDLHNFVIGEVGNAFAGSDNPFAQFMGGMIEAYQFSRCVEDNAAAGSLDLSSP